MHDVIDARLVAALHLSQARRQAFDDAAPGAGSHELWQVSTIARLLDGGYEGDLTIGELLAHGDLGLGTVQRLDGELVVLDGEAWCVGADRGVRPVPPAELTPFAVVCRFSPGPPTDLAGPLDLSGLCGVLDELAPADEPAVAVRVDGRFDQVGLRSVPRQDPPYRPLTEVVGHQTSWTVAGVEGTLVGFRFPAEIDGTEGVEVPGFHLHFLSRDRRIGGHVTALDLAEGTALVDGSHELHLELPPGVDLGTNPADADLDAAIARVEGRTSSTRPDLSETLTRDSLRTRRSAD